MASYATLNLHSRVHSFKSLTRHHRSRHPHATLPGQELSPSAQKCPAPGAQPERVGSQNELLVPFSSQDYGYYATAAPAVYNCSRHLKTGYSQPADFCLFCCGIFVFYCLKSLTIYPLKLCAGAVASLVSRGTHEEINNNYTANELIL
ncbi:unnamed protein product [Protopolystoma xenopodis]|uniref:Uncharacterized protein n=1 Tax=Protopolystoma xenopodis TaxID=117903 RepID=A0A3S4ZZ10_9PLAT|nr:unnamed protein product [Protopolystoma xenopodis]